MKVAVFSARNYDFEFLAEQNATPHELHFFEPHLNEQTAALTAGFSHLSLDIYGEEQEIFFEDRSGLIIPDDVFARLLTFPNVIITGHQAFFTREALENIASTTIDNITKFEDGQTLKNQLLL